MRLVLQSYLTTYDLYGLTNQNDILSNKVYRATRNYIIYVNKS